MKSIQISFSVEYDQSIFIGENIIAAEPSIIFEPSPRIDAFSIHPYHWSFELTTLKISHTKFLLCYAMGSMCLLNCEHAELKIPESRKGKVYANFSHPPYADGIYYNECSNFLPHSFYDSSRKIFAVGDINATQHECIEIASNQFVVINQAGELICVYIQINQ